MLQHVCYFKMRIPKRLMGIEQKVPTLDGSQKETQSQISSIVVAL